MGILRVNNKEIKLRQIKVQSRLNEIYLEPEFSFSIHVYEPNEEDNPLIISYEYVIKAGILNANDLLNLKIDLDFSDLNKYGNLIYVGHEEFEAIGLSIRIDENPFSKSIIGSGHIRNIRTKQVISLSFQGVIDFPKTEYIEYDFSNYKFQRHSMINVLEIISNKNELINYKKSVPYVHIPTEVLNQWESAYGINYKWFYDEYNVKEIQELVKIDEQISLLCKDFEGQHEYFPDVPEILENMKWKNIMINCHNTLKIIKSKVTKWT